MSVAIPQSPTSFGDLLKLLRKRARLTQRELGLAVGYSEAHITRLEGGTRQPDPTVVQALFVDALDLGHDPKLTQQLIELARQASLKPVEQPTPWHPNITTNLPATLAHFIGRQTELATVTKLLQDSRLVTLVGAGGMGKTRLAMETGAALVGQFPDGVWLVELASITDIALVPQTVASVFNVVDQPGRAVADTLRVLLAGKQTLLILDNCEHLIDTCATLSAALLQSCPSLHILATSREALNIQGERVWRVPSLSVVESVQLFVDRARIAGADFKLTDQNTSSVQTICERLDGIPLAIELAASRLNVLAIEQLAARLSDRFRLLTNGSRIALPRHRTLRAMIDWSHDLLSNQEQVLLRRLSVFAGGWTAEAAEAVCATPAEMEGTQSVLYAPNVLPLLLNLVNKSLVVVDEQGPAMRYHMLETIGQYAREQLEVAGETEWMHGQHAHHMLAFLKTTAPEQIREVDSPFQMDHMSMACLAWIKQMESERDNLRTALMWALQDEHDIGTGIELALWQSPMWTLRGPRNEGRKWLQCALTHLPAGQSTRLRATVMAYLAGFVHRMGDNDRALFLFNEALSIFRNLNDRFGIMFTLCRQANLSAKYFDDAEANVQEWLSIATELGDSCFAGMAFWFLGIIYSKRNDLPRALEYHEASLRRLPTNEIGLRHCARYYHVLALRQAGQTEGTLEQIYEALAFFRECGFVLGVVVSLQYLGVAALSAGNFNLAHDHLTEGLTTAYRNGARLFTWWYFTPFATLAAAQGNPVQAITLEAVIKSLEASAFSPNDELRRARAQLDEQALAAAEAAGRAMSFDEMVAFALAG